MLKSIQIQNFKSIMDLTLNPSRVNVFIGENGSGKSNILEALVCMALSDKNSIDNTFFSLRGVRVTEAKLMTSCFTDDLNNEIKIIINTTLEQDELSYTLTLKQTHSDYTKWSVKNTVFDEALKLISEKSDEDFPLPTSFEKLDEEFENLSTKNITVRDIDDNHINRKIAKIMPLLIRLMPTMLKSSILQSMKHVERYKDFLIYSPENTALREFEKIGQIEPLGIQGEGLLKLLKIMQKQGKTEQLEDILELVKLFGWFEDFEIPKDDLVSNNVLTIFDQYISTPLDHRSVNEGFLFVLFYATAIVSDETPPCFAIDNIDASLNPKLCRELIKCLTVLAKKYDKQIFCTTHNPAILDGIDLNGEDQRLFVVSRGLEGNTVVKRIENKEGKASNTRLSEAFMRGYLGGLPKGF